MTCSRPGKPKDSRPQEQRSLARDATRAGVACPTATACAPYPPPRCAQNPTAMRGRSAVKSEASATQASTKWAQGPQKYPPGPHGGPLPSPAAQSATPTESRRRELKEPARGASGGATASAPRAASSFPQRRKDTRKKASQQPANQHDVCSASRPHHSVGWGPAGVCRARAVLSGAT